MKNSEVKFNEDGTVTIPKNMYEEFVDDHFWRICLENGGVDNWEWYGESLQQGGYFKDEEEDDE